MFVDYQIMYVLYFLFSYYHCHSNIINQQSLFGLHRHSPSTDITENYPFDYEPFRRNSDGGYNIGDSQKRK